MVTAENFLCEADLWDTACFLEVAVPGLLGSGGLAFCGYDFGTMSGTRHNDARLMFLICASRSQTPPYRKML
jgi:hypothetical protein